MAFRGWKKSKIVLPNGNKVDAICPVIVSASRATDVPAFFSTWFRNRLEAGFVRWTNPFNAEQVQYVSFQNTRVIVFWSKNPKPIMRYLPEIEAKGINYYFQFTLNDYEQEGFEPNVPAILHRVDTFKALVDRIGADRVIWRYDPIILTNSLTLDILIERISRVANMLRGYANSLIFSFADIGVYKNVQNNLMRQQVRYREFTPEIMSDIADRLSRLNAIWKLRIATCAEGIDLDRFGIDHNKCIDDNLMIKVFKKDNALLNFLGYQPKLFGDPNRPYLKDMGQRKECGCIVSKDIGMYGTCNHLCTYCYANSSCKVVENNRKRHKPDSESII
jgi:hypothetical protein